MKVKNAERTFRKLVLLMMAVPAAMMPATLGPAMTKIVAEFSMYRESLATMILTIPNLTIVLGLVLAPVLVKRISAKTLMMSGLGIYLLGALGGAFCYNFYGLLALRACMGIGCGLILPLQMTFFATFPVRERGALLGNMVMISCLVAAATTILSGQIAVHNWHYCFLLYMLNLPTLLLGIRYLPNHIDAQEEKKTGSDEGSKKGKEAESANGYRKILGSYYFMLIGGYLFITCTTAELAPYLQSTGFGDSQISGVVQSMILIGSMISGLVLNRFLKILKGWAMSVVFLIVAVGFLSLWAAPMLAIVMMGALFLGFGSSVMTQVAIYDLSLQLPLEIYTGASAGLNLIVFALQFTGPWIFLGFLGAVPGESYRLVFMIYGLIQLGMVGVSAVLKKAVLKV